MNTTSKNLQSSSRNINNHSDESFEKGFFCSNKTYIDPTAIIGPNVSIGNNVKIGPFCILIGNITIKNNTKIYSNVIIGSTAQHTTISKPLGKIIIGKNCTIKEFVTIGSSIYENGKTNIGDNCFIMNYSHIAHDVTIEENVVLINNVNLGGHVYIEKNAFLMANCAAHQFCKIGQYTSLAPYSAIRQDLPPFCLFSGLSAKFYGLNLIALRRANIAKKSINALKHLTKLFYQDKLLLTDIKKLATKEIDWGKDKYVNTFLKFVEQSKRGISKKTINATSQG